MKQCSQCAVRFRDRLDLCPIDGGTLIALQDPLIGRVVQERYLIEDLIGQGGMGSVYRGRHQVLGRDVALKFLAAKLARDSGSRQRFLREARAVNRVQHEHIIDVTDVGETEDGLAYMVMEYLTGRPLGDEIEKGPMAPARACHIVLQLSAALARAHELGVVHRDIKPANVFLIRKAGDDDYVKLLDFGLARVHDDVSLTKSNSLFGTPEYMAPEQANGGAISSKADLYALGCVLFEMLTGKLPFEGAPTGLIYKHVYEPPPRIKQLRSDLPDRLDSLVARLLHKDPAQRHTNAYELAAEITAIAATLPRGQAQPVTISKALALVEAPTLSLRNEEERWRESLAVMQARISAKVPKGPAGNVLRASVEQASALISDVQQLRKELDAISVSSAERHDAIRSARLRVGTAIDTLAADETRIGNECDALAAEHKAAQQRLEREAQRLLAALRTFDVSGAQSQGALDPGRLLLVANDWARAQQAAFAAQASLEAKEAARNDLRFQLSHLKGRLASLEADSSAAQEPADARAVQLETQINAKLYAVRLEAARITSDLHAHE